MNITDTMDMVCKYCGEPLWKDGELSECTIKNDEGWHHKCEE